MTRRPIRIGLVGCGRQVQNEYLPFLLARSDSKMPTELVWVSGYLDRHDMEVKLALGGDFPRCVPGSTWRQWLDCEVSSPYFVDAVIVSVPNALHADAVRLALMSGKHVAVDKPTALRVADIEALCEIAASKSRVLTTLSQRRYEEIYKTMATAMETKALGTPVLVSYLIGHDDFGARHNLDVRLGWEHSKELAGGGVLIHSAYHGLDAIMWLLRKRSPKITASAVNCRWRVDKAGKITSLTEEVCVASVQFEPDGCLLSLVALNQAPAGSLDEEIKIYGELGCLRMTRHRLSGRDRGAGTLSFQRIDGHVIEYDTRQWIGDRCAPLAHFLELIANPEMHAASETARDSIEVMRIIEAAYDSATKHGKTVTL